MYTENDNSKLVFTSILSKSALQFNSYKSKNILKNQFKIDKHYVHLVDEIFLDKIFSDDKDDFVALLQQYQIDFNNFDRMVKLHRFSEKGNNYRLKYNNRKKQTLKNWFSVVNPTVS